MKDKRITLATQNGLEILHRVTRLPFMQNLNFPFILNKNLFLFPSECATYWVTRVSTP